MQTPTMQANPAIVPTQPVQRQPQPVQRFTTSGLMQDRREVEIEHAGRIYRLRITQLNKLILTA
ncbi:hemin uptake protein HemP [Pseudoduganella buxea]|uniref:Hemin uptake protein HemP n=2 Tax=Pseudoduganella buxea TaxID=1949069 RepID=A0ABQ1K3C8_9BURK|nr:hemin uptake protein HemP [Pseudoduganella buxea]GGB85446.1 hypothetical protein GCM10011572_04250 [Pseudoduganella buxea]